MAYRLFSLDDGEYRPFVMYLKTLLFKMNS